MKTKRSRRPTLELLEDRVCPSLSIGSPAGHVDFFPLAITAGVPETISFKIVANSVGSFGSTGNFSLTDNFTGSFIEFIDGVSTQQIPLNTGTRGLVGTVDPVDAGVMDESFTVTYPQPTPSTLQSDCYTRDTGCLTTIHCKDRETGRT